MKLKDPVDVIFTHGDVEDLTSNPAWERMMAELHDEYLACIETLLALDHSEAIKARVIKNIIERPKGLLDKLEEERTDGIKSGRHSTNR